MSTTLTQSQTQKGPGEGVNSDGKPDWEVKAEQAGYTPKQTIGEKIFNWITYGGIADFAVFVGGIGVGYLFKHSSHNFPGSKALTGEARSFSGMWDIAVDKTANLPFLKDRGVANHVLMTTALMMPGNLAIPVIRKLEKNKKSIVHYFNEKFGQAAKDGVPSDAQVGDWKIHQEPAQSWGSLIKGRMLTFVTVYSSFFAFNALSPGTLGKVEENTGEFAITQALKIKPDLSQKWQSRIEKFGQVAFIDFFATAAAAILLFVSSKAFAGAAKKHAPHEKTSTVKLSAPAEVVYPVSQDVAQTRPTAQHSATVNPREVRYVTENMKEPKHQLVGIGA